VMHVTSEDHRMNVTDSEDGKYHQCNVKMEKALTSQVHRWKDVSLRKLKKMPHLYLFICPNVSRDLP